MAKLIADRRDYLIWIALGISYLVLAFIAAYALGIIGSAVAKAHDHVAGASAEQNRVYEFYSHWNRPKGNFVGIGHRTQSCCRNTDCFPVVEAHIARGVLWVRIQYPNGDVSSEYRVDPAILESNQEDPRESPDARSHACVIGGTIVCFVEGVGG